MGRYHRMVQDKVSLGQGSAEVDPKGGVQQAVVGEGALSQRKD